MMPDKTVTLNVPAATFRKLQQAAELTDRSVDEILTSTIDAALPAPPGLPTDLAARLAAMHLLSDEALLAAARSSLAPADQERLHQLNETAGERALTAAERAEQAALLEAYQRSVLQRAQALAILTQRGHSVKYFAQPYSDISGAEGSGKTSPMVMSSPRIT